MRMRFSACLVSLVAIVGACGGRSITTDTGEDSGGSSTGGGTHATAGRTNNGATGSYGASSSAGGVPSVGGTAFGGYVGVGGTSPSTCVCPPIACPPNFVPVPSPDGCCYQCESICNQIGCPAIGCGSGSHLEMAPGQCCPTCVQDECEKQQAAYEDFKKQLVEKYSSIGCMTANDCTIYWEKNECGAGCGTAIPNALVDSLDSNLQSYARQTCSPDCPFTVRPCDAPAGPFCIKGRCQ